LCVCGNVKGTVAADDDAAAAAAAAAVGGGGGSKAADDTVWGKSLISFRFARVERIAFAIGGRSLGFRLLLVQFTTVLFSLFVALVRRFGNSLESGESMLSQGMVC